MLRKTPALSWVGLLIALFALPSEARKGERAAEPPRAAEVDAYGNVVRDADGTPHAYSESQLALSRERAGAGADAPPSAQSIPQGELPLPAIAATPADALRFQEIWRTSVWGSGIGFTGLVPADLDGDGVLEVVVGANAAGNFGANSFWYVLSYAPQSRSYEIRWSSDPRYEITAIAVLRLAGDTKVLVGRADGRIDVHRGAELSSSTTIAPSTSPVRCILLADADNDGADEIVVLTNNAILLLDPVSLQEQHRIPYGPTDPYLRTDAAVGNVDRDAGLEIVVSTGLVLEFDGTTSKTEWDYRPTGFGSRIGLADFDRDGDQEIVGASSWYYITTFDAVLRTPSWQIRPDLDVGAMRLFDVTGDGIPEILYGDGQWGEIHAISAATRSELWAIPNPDHGVTNIAVADTDADGVLEVLWGAGYSSTGADHLHVHSVANRALEFRSMHVDGPFRALDVGDVDGDGADEMVAVSFESESGYDDGVVFVYGADDFALEWNSGTGRFQRNAWTGVQDVAVGDVDDDGKPEFVVATDRLYDGALYVFDGATKGLEWMRRYDSGSPMQTLAIADVDADGRTEIVASNSVAHTGSPGTFVYVLDGRTGGVEWKSVSLVGGFSSAYALEVADLDADGLLEIVATVGGRMRVVDGRTRALRQSPETDYVALETADLDGDGRAELFGGSNAGRLYRLDPASLGRTLVGSPCTSSNSVHSLEAGVGGPLEGTLAFSCGDSVGIFGLFEGTVLWSSGAIGLNVAWADNLRILDRDPRARLVFGGPTGLRVYEGLGTRDTDVDDDGVANHVDNCPETVNAGQEDNDGDGVGNACNDASDPDGDEWADARDNCDGVLNPDQDDADLDGVGNACNDAQDADGDEWADALDNCPELANPGQANRDRDPLGDACDRYPDNPDNERARCEEAIENEFRLAFEVAECQDRHADVDADGEIDRNDACPGTPAGAAVDSAGCAQEQYCRSVQLGAPGDRRACSRADWRNDEPHETRPRDCVPSRSGRRFDCVARPAPAPGSDDDDGDDEDDD